MCTLAVNNNLRLIEALKMDANGFDVLNDGSFAFLLFREMEGAVGPHEGQMKNWRFCS